MKAVLEARIQADIMQYLQSNGIFAHSVPNEGAAGNRVRTMQLMSMGLRPGVGDLVVWWHDASMRIRIGYLEVKNEMGRQSDSQRRFQRRCESAGVDYAVVRSVADVQEYMRRTGLR